MSKRAPTTSPSRPYRYTVNLPDLIADTQQLDAKAFGAYMRLLHAHWRSGPAKDSDRMLARIAGMSPAEWASVRPDLEPFFDVIGGSWMHWQTDQDLEAAYAAINANRDRTKAATDARKARAGQRDVARNVDRNDDRDVARNVVLTVSKGAHPLYPAAPAKAEDDFSSVGFGADGRISEREILAGGAR
jgi:uncharacterized protein YdaU (DUF1376 family)